MSESSLFPLLEVFTFISLWGSVQQQELGGLVWGGPVSCSNEPFTSFQGVFPQVASASAPEDVTEAQPWEEGKERADNPPPPPRDGGSGTARTAVL